MIDLPGAALIYVFISENKMSPLVATLDLCEFPFGIVYVASSCFIPRDVRPAMIVCDNGADRVAVEQSARIVRARPDVVAYAPILAVGSPSAAASGRASDGIDRWLAPDTSGDALHDILTSWRPLENPTLDRLFGVFGREEITSLTLGFRDLLIAAMDGVATARTDGIAHRVAGMAGTLGFASLSACWNAFDDAGHDHDRVMRETRLAIYAIGLQLGQGT